MSRPIWKGHITFGLVSIPVVLYAADKHTNIKFNLVDSRDKSRIRYLRVNEKTGSEVPWAKIAKAYEYDNDQYIVLKDQDLKNIAGENSKTIEIESFIQQDSLDYMDLDKPYYLVPDKKGDKGYVILREVLKATKKIGIAHVFIHTRQYLAALMPYKDALVINLLRYHQELRQPSDFDLPKDDIKKYKISSKEIEIAKKLVASMTEKWKPDAYQDDYHVKLQTWIDENIHHKKRRKTNKDEVADTKPGNVINFTDLLKKSLQAHKKNSNGAKKKKKSTSNGKRKHSS